MKPVSLPALSCVGSPLMSDELLGPRTSPCCVQAWTLIAVPVQQGHCPLDEVSITVPVRVHVS